MGKYVKMFYSCLIILSVWLQFGFQSAEQPGFAVNNVLKNDTSDSLYNQLNLSQAGLSKEAFANAMKGYNYLKSIGKIGNDDMLSIIDFSLPSSSKRLFVIDLKNNVLVFNTLVSHGKNSGLKTAEHFSNAMQSFESSLGFYVTADAYMGKHGYSLRLQGEENGINDNAFARGIVMHCAAYVDENIAQERGYIGRSEGCPAVPQNIYKPIIQKIKGGSCLYIYSPDKFYAAHSEILNQKLLSLISLQDAKTS